MSKEYHARPTTAGVAGHDTPRDYVIGCLYGCGNVARPHVPHVTPADSARSTRGSTAHAAGSCRHVIDTSPAVHAPA